MANAPVAPSPTPLGAIDFAKLTEVYRRIRDTKAERQKAWEAEEAGFDKQLATIEGVMLQHLNASNVDSVATSGGTFYKQEDVKPNIVDDKLFYQWIKDNDAFDALERRVKKTFVKEFMDAEANEAHVPPPGINVSRQWVVRVRKPA